MTKLSNDVLTPPIPGNHSDDWDLARDISSYASAYMARLQPLAESGMGVVMIETLQDDTTAQITGILSEWTDTALALHDDREDLLARDMDTAGIDDVIARYILNILLARGYFYTVTQGFVLPGVDAIYERHAVFDPIHYPQPPKAIVIRFPLPGDQAETFTLQTDTSRLLQHMHRVFQRNDLTLEDAVHLVGGFGQTEMPGYSILGEIEDAFIEARALGQRINLAHEQGDRKSAYEQYKWRMMIIRQILLLWEEEHMGKKRHRMGKKLQVGYSDTRKTKHGDQDGDFIELVLYYPDSDTPLRLKEQMIPRWLPDSFNFKHIIWRGGGFDFGRAAYEAARLRRKVK